MKPKVEYLGYVEADAKNVLAVQGFSVPSNVKSLKSFLGVASHYQRFIHGFSNISHPLNQLNRKHVDFIWNINSQAAFQELKRDSPDAQTLAFPDFNREFLLETDASKTGLGAVLSQTMVEVREEVMCLIAFASRTLQSKYGVTELKALTVVWAVKIPARISISNPVK